MSDSRGNRRIGWPGRVALAAAAVAVAAVVAAAGCSSGGDDSADATTSTAPATQATTTATQPAPTGAVPAVQDDHLPVDPVETLPARIDMIAATGARVTRLDLFWSGVAPNPVENPEDPADPGYDFSRYDMILEGLAAKGITPIMSVYNSPAWAADGQASQNPVNPAAPDPDAYAKFMTAVATRYGGGFAGRESGRALPAVRYFEMWNEPNLSAYLSPQVEDGQRVSLDNYAAMVKAAYPAIKAANPEAQVIAGVGGPRGLTSDTGTGALDWLRGLVERQIPLDGYSQHIYPAAAPTAETMAFPSWSSVDQILAEIERFRPGLPLYITEAGYTTAETSFRDVKVTDAEQARYLTQIYALPQVQNPRVRAIVWFNLQDNVNWPAGLLREDGSEKPSYAAFQEVTASSADGL